MDIERQANDRPKKGPGIKSYIGAAIAGLAIGHQVAENAAQHTTEQAAAERPEHYVAQGTLVKIREEVADSVRFDQAGNEIHSEQRDTVLLIWLRERGTYETLRMSTENFRVLGYQEGAELDVTYRIEQGSEGPHVVIEQYAPRGSVI